MNTKDLSDILCRIPTTYYERTSDGIKYKEWDTEDLKSKEMWDLFSEMEDLTGEFCAYVFSDSVCTPLIETAKRKLSLYVEWWDNCKDSPNIRGIISIKLGDFYVVCRQWLSIINEALKADGAF